MFLRVATIGSAHGLKGQVRLDLHTDDPETRFAPRATVQVEGTNRALEVENTRWANGHLLVKFIGCNDRTAAESLRGLVLVAPAVPSDASGLAEAEADAYYAHELRGLPVFDRQGNSLGQVSGLSLGTAQDQLLVDYQGRQISVPFVKALVPEVDLAAGRVVVDPPGGLFEEDYADEI